MVYCRGLDFRIESADKSAVVSCGRAAAIFSLADGLVKRRGGTATKALVSASFSAHSHIDEHIRAQGA